jgi:hypothetical protein
MEITTVKDAQGAAIEKKVVSGISIDINSGAINLNHSNSIKRIDGEWIESQNNGMPLSLIKSDFAGADLTAFNNALSNFKTLISGLAAKKLGV